jgi:hypothetical protein
VEAARAAQQGLAVTNEIEARVWEPRFHEARAELASTLGDDGERERELRLARQGYEDVGAIGRASRLARELAPGEGR